MKNIYVEGALSEIEYRIKVARSVLSMSQDYVSVEKMPRECQHGLAAVDDLLLALEVEIDVIRRRVADEVLS